MKLKPTGCLECISADMTGLMCEFLGFGGTVLLYGLLSEKPAGGIDTIGFIGKNLTLESFLLTNYLQEKSLTEPVDQKELVGSTKQREQTEVVLIVCAP